MSTMKLSNLGETVIKFFEELVLVAYPDSGGIWTCGWGHTGKDVVKGTTCTPGGAEIWFLGDVKEAVDAVNSLVTIELKQIQFDALVSFTFNDGVEALRNSALLKFTNAGQFEYAGAEFLKWVHVKGQVNKGLVKRRTLESALYLS
jgi:lysozyme